MRALQFEPVHAHCTLDLPYPQRNMTEAQWFNVIPSGRRLFPANRAAATYPKYRGG